MSVYHSGKKMKPHTLILGLGNVLMGDEGVGIRCIDYLRGKEGLENVDLLDGGTGGFHLLSLFNQYDHFILIDATLNEENPGEVKMLRPKFAADFPRSLTSHDIGLRDLLQTAELLDELPDIHLITISVKDVRQMGMDLSDQLNQSLPRVHDAVLKIIEEQDG
jgi:hydrogenase maturation protease